jgi:hypothetical protein
MRRAILGTLAALLVAAPCAAAQAPAEPYDGHNPFTCTLQQLGQGTKFPQPDADPFCVEYDKTHQNVTELGFFQFLSKEPARVAAASPKCFYFQRDHWTGSVVQGQPPETYHWDGSYWFNKASGAGGVYVENFRVGGTAMDPTTLPGFPAQYKQYFAGGKGGYQADGEVQADPRCATRPNPSGPGGGGGGGGGGQKNGNGRCRVPGGRIGQGIGGVRLHEWRSRARRDLGKPAKESIGYASWCFDGGGRLVAAFGKRHARVQLLMTNARPFDVHRFRTGSRARTAHRRMRHERRIGRVRGAAAWCSRERRRVLCAGLAKRHVRWIAIGRHKHGAKRTLRYLRGAARL